jgi:hypothetical protein
VAITEKLNEAANGTLSWAGEVNSGADWALASGQPKRRR